MSGLTQASVQQIVDLERQLTTTTESVPDDTDQLNEGAANLYMTSAEKTKLSNIEDNATADQTDAEIVTAWETQTGITSTDIIERDGSVAFTGPPVVPSYTVAGVPSAAMAAQIIYVSDETGGAVLAFSDGTNWRRVTDRAIVS